MKIKINELSKLLGCELSCNKCGNLDDLCIDHKTPISRGGNNNFDNLQILCRKCNSEKGTKTVDEWIKYKKLIHAYNCISHLKDEFKKNDIDNMIILIYRYGSKKIIKAIEELEIGSV